MVACGGTGGHIFPGLSVAAELRRRGVDVTILLAGKQIEKTALADWDGPVLTVAARGLDRRRPGAALTAALRLLSACYQWRRLMRAAPPDALLAMGGYASGGPVLAARSLRVPIVLHEANVIPGLAVRLLSRFAQAVALGFDEAREHLRHPRLELTGIPLRAIRPSAEPDARLAALPSDVFTVLVMGGSAGARRLNELLPAAVQELARRGRRLQVIHLAGTASASAVEEVYRQIPGVTAVVYPFLHNMPQVYRRANLAICRAGAATCAELLQFGTPALLVPYPFAANDHQAANAMAMQKYGVADMLREGEATAGKLADYITQAMEQPERLAKMRAAAAAHALSDAAARVADLLQDLARHHHSKKSGTGGMSNGKK
jgi:UDP-N-acetylglucosamine--N-acetylmuramyl-(pentapeptide) pyrophosphoryl-undecaprenol N-acetylglucosamine transferase